MHGPVGEGGVRPCLDRRHDERGWQLGLEDRDDRGPMMAAGGPHGACAVVGGGGRRCHATMVAPHRPFRGAPCGMHGTVDGTDVAAPPALERCRQQQREHRQQGGAA